MAQALINKTQLAKLISFLAGAQKIVAPVPLGHNQFKFTEVSKLAEIALKYIPTILPPKKYFMPPQETLLEYDLSDGQQMQALIETEPLVLFGLHSCDLAGILCLDQVFSAPPADINYQTRRQHLTLIGLECNSYCDDYASCALLSNHLPDTGYDLFLTELDDHYFVDVATGKGEQLLAASNLFEPATQNARNQLQTIRKMKKKTFAPELAISPQELPALFKQSYTSEIWEQLGKKCLSCGNCTNVCPTCYCFDLIDEPELDLRKGRRLRVWDSCQHENFAKVAGGESFREKRADRQRHRFNRKFNYQVQRHKRIFCTGCGRCSRSCMARIDLKETINALLKERG